MQDSDSIPQAFFWRRLHSLMGLALALFLTEHLLTNSQAALFFNEDGNGFVQMVNWIHNLPFLPLIEISLIGLPLAIHIIWGTKYLLTAHTNSFPGGGSRPYLNYERNHAYTWQRITSWILAVCVPLHIVQMRFMEYPAMSHGGEKSYIVRLGVDDGLYTVADRLDVALYSEEMLAAEKNRIESMKGELDSEVQAAGPGYNAERARYLIQKQAIEEEEEWLHAAFARPLQGGDVIAVANNFGTAVLLTVRETFKSFWLAAIYTLFVLAASFHAYNGLWTFLITWGVTLSARSQALSLFACRSLIAAVSILGLVAIWCTYWITLYS